MDTAYDQFKNLKLEHIRFAATENTETSDKWKSGMIL